ncbi:MAG: ferrous iron transport protein B [Pirellulales bacterium]|nr:ferrous iron transport protein B [Pirellulales bacterium]
MATIAETKDFAIRQATIALVGNPNTGKSTLFGALAGIRQRVGNYPGVTVEKKLGQMNHAGRKFQLIDLPGTYSLAPRSLDEMVAVDVLLGRRGDVSPVDAVICIVDASNLERNLYLVSQVLAMGLPTVIALNMMDVARTRGLAIDVDRLSRQLGVTVVPIEAHRRRGLDDLKQAVLAALDQPVAGRPSPFPEQFESEVDALAALSSTTAAAPRYLTERLLLDTTGYLAHELTHGDQRAAGQIAAARQRLADAGLPVPAVEAMARYGWVAQTLAGVVSRPSQRPVTLSDRIDRVLTHRVWGTLFFALVMLAMFQSVFVWAGPAMDWIDGLMGAAGEMIGAWLPEGPLRSLLIDGVIGGFGSVLVFLPQIFILFFFISVLEDCGYMARAAFLMDKLMSRVGLSGKSFIPLLSSFACAVPGVMATRVIENRRDRLTTILVAPLMSCSARLPVYTVLIAAFIPDRAWLAGVLSLQGLTLTAMYLLGIVVAVGMAILLKRSLLKGPTPPFVMELPSYKLPSPGTVLHRMADRGWAFVRRAGTLIVAVSIVVWALLYFPRSEAVTQPLADRLAATKAEMNLPDLTTEQLTHLRAEAAALDREFSGIQQRQSYLGRMGRFIEPVVRPLGWDWRIGCAVIASFPAREVVVATLGVIYNLGSELDVAADADRTQLAAALQQAKWDDSERPVYNVPVALSIMVFFALCAQCAATLAVIRRETNSWFWPTFTFVYMTSLAYLAALVTYQVGIRLAS